MSLRLILGFSQTSRGSMIGRWGLRGEEKEGSDRTWVTFPEVVDPEGGRKKSPARTQARGTLGVHLTVRPLMHSTGTEGPRPFSHDRNRPTSSAVVPSDRQGNPLLSQLLANERSRRRRSRWVSRDHTHRTAPGLSCSALSTPQ